MHCTAHWQSGGVTEEDEQRVHVTEVRYRGCRADHERKHARGNYGAGRAHITGAEAEEASGHGLAPSRKNNSAATPTPSR